MIVRLILHKRAYFYANDSIVLCLANLMIKIYEKWLYEIIAVTNNKCQRIVNIRLHLPPKKKSPQSYLFFSRAEGKGNAENILVPLL